jgi:glycine/D-amino acid oxidase-like deaminating enzyme
MKNYDWIVIGGGITGAALGYELARKDFSVLLLEQQNIIENATRYSYGGLAYWSGTTGLTRQLCDEGIARHRILSEELDSDTEFRELDLLLTIPTEDNPEEVAASYARFAIKPRLVSVEEACEIEPLLNKDAIAGALVYRHGHIQPEKTAEAYVKAFRRAGGEIKIDRVVELLREGTKIQGVKTATETYRAANTVVCAGGFSRALLKASGIPMRVYFTHAEMIETPPVDLKLRSLVMPADTTRFQLEAEASTDKVDALWDEPGNEPVPPILDAGAIQFKDGSLRIGQISRVLTDPNAKVDASESEANLRAAIGKIVPALENLSGNWHECLVAFSSDRLPLVGAIANMEGVYIFSGFSNPLVFVPSIAQRFASWAAGQQDEIIAQLSPQR